MTPIALSDHFSTLRLLRFTWPSMLMVIISSIYGVVDGVIVSNLLGTMHFAALNLIWPFVAILGSIGFMMGTGGNALVAKTLGEGNTDQARTIFSMLTYATALMATLLGILGFCLVRPVAVFLGAEGEMVNLCQQYGSILLLALPAFALQAYFQALLITAERPKLGMWVTIASGVLNMLLDVLFVAVWHWGLAGAAWATALGQLFGAGVPLAYFVMRRRKKHLTLRLGRCRFHADALLVASSNGMSEFVIQVSISMVSMLYMYQLLHVAGEDGVAAYGVMMYFAYVFCSIFIGFSIGAAPVLSFHYGAQNHVELHSLLCKILLLVAVLSVGVEAVAQMLAQPLCAFFMSYDAHLLAYTIRAFRIYSIMFLYTGFNVCASGFFTALNNGPISALISVLRTMGFEALCVLTIPILFGIDGIWWSVNVGEGLTLLVAIWLVWHYRRRYGY